MLQPARRCASASPRATRCSSRATTTSGSAVNLASRLCDAAGPGEVLLPADQLHDLPPGAVATPVGSVSLPGFPDALEVVELSGEPAPASNFDTGELWTRTPFAV